MKRSAASAAAVLLLATGAAPAADIELRSGTQHVRVSLTGGLPVGWISCAGACDGAETNAMALLRADPAGGEFRWHGADASAVEAMLRLEYETRIEETPDKVTAMLESHTPVLGRKLVQRYELSRLTHTLAVRLQSPPGIGVSVSPVPGFTPAPLPGFGRAFSHVEAIRVNGNSQQPLRTAEAPGVVPGEWIGVRSHFWAWLANPAAAGTRVKAGDTPNTLQWEASGDGDLDLVFYAGPVEWKSLRAVSPDLPNMLFAGLWAPLRWLSFALFFLLALITRWITNPGVAIIVLSLCVKIVLWPLTRIAERWQQQVNRTQSRLQPRLDVIKRELKGEEAHRRTLQVYQEEGVSPWFTLKSLAGFAIQVPMFIAAFDMLADNFALSGSKFLWITDLARPDAFAALPVILPFFGGYLNLLPVIMTALTVFAAMLQRNASLTPELVGRQRRQLYLLAGAFFLLFYTFPAGMVLYWTANNFWHLVKEQITARLA